MLCFRQPSGQNLALCEFPFKGALLDATVDWFTRAPRTSAPARAPARSSSGARAVREAGHGAWALCSGPFRTVKSPRNVKTTRRTLAWAESHNEKAECRLVPPSGECALPSFPPLPLSLNDLGNAASTDLGVPKNLE